MEFADLGFLKKMTRAVLRLGEQTTNDADLVLYLNDAYRRHLISANWWWAEKAADLEITRNDGTVELPDDFRRIKQLVFDHRDLEPLSPFDMPYFQQRNGRPEYYAVRVGELILAPRPEDGGTAQLIYYLAPAELVNDSDKTVVPKYASQVLYFLAAKTAAGAGHDFRGLRPTRPTTTSESSGPSR